MNEWIIKLTLQQSSIASQDRFQSHHNPAQDKVGNEEWRNELLLLGKHKQQSMILMCNRMYTLSCFLIR